MYSSDRQAAVITNTQKEDKNKYQNYISDYSGNMGPILWVSIETKEIYYTIKVKF